MRARDRRKQKRLAYEQAGVCLDRVLALDKNPRASSMEIHTAHIELREANVGIDKHKRLTNWLKANHRLVLPLLLAMIVSVIMSLALRR